MSLKPSILSSNTLKSLSISSLTTLSYIVLYTSYDKQSKKINIKLLYDILRCKYGYDRTFVEFNKVISLSGLSTMLLAYIPYYNNMKLELILISMNMLWLHSTYSMYKFYSFKVSNVMRDKVIKRLSVLFGGLGQISLLLGYTGRISYPLLALSSSCLGIAHFWTMEVDYKYKLQVRPYAYLPFPLAAAAIYYSIKGLFV